MKEFLQYGGQAVIEGVMMRSPRYFAVACRKPDGEIVIQQEALEGSILAKLKWLNKPFLRGTLALIDAMMLGTKALTFAANVQAVELPTGGARAKDTSDAGAAKTKRINDIAIGFTMVFAFAFGLGLFVALPTLLTQIIQDLLGISSSVGRNFVDGVIRIVIFLSYIALISRMHNIYRVFQYHGAEHKTINALEAGIELTPDNCMKASRIHPRCGTSFIIVVLLVGILIHCLFPRPDNFFVRLALHLSLIPLVAGIGYEVIRLAGKFKESIFTRVLLAPGLWSQQLTTREPDISQVEVAIASLQAVLDAEQGRTKEAEQKAAVA